MRKVLIVDDSRTARAALRQAIEIDPEILVVGEAENGPQAIKAVHKTKPDLITMDLFLRRESGLDVTRLIMQQCARPILLVTSADTKNPDLIYRAISSGVLDVSAKLPAPKHLDYEKRCRRLQRMIKSLSKVPVVHRHSWPDRPARVANSPKQTQVTPPLNAAVRCIVIGVSTGGPPALEALLKKLKSPFRLPIVVVQHLTNGFVTGFAEWLQDSTGHKIHIVKETTELTAGKVYLPNDDRHVIFSSPRTLDSSTTDTVNYIRPSIDVLFQSTALHLGSRAVAVIMTGMGKDGTQGLGQLSRCGCLTIAQEPSTCVVDSMPRHAIEAQCISDILNLNEIAERLGSLG